MTNRAELLVNGDTILPSLLADLRAARRTIHVSMFLWFHDPIGDEIADALIERARAGVKVRVLLNVEKTAMGDPFSTGEAKMMKHDPSVHHDATDVKPLCHKMRDAGIEVRDTNIDYHALIPGLDARLRSVAAQIRDTIELSELHIDHRKIVVVDGRIGYCGGANIGAQYMYHLPFDPTKDAYVEGDERKARGEPEPWWKWHDSLTRFEGPIAADLDEHFRERLLLDGGADFALEVAPDEGTPRGMPIREARVVWNAPNDQPNEICDLYVRLIREARRSIFIENPYFYHPALVDALCEAKTQRPELDVTLVLPARKWNDNEFAHDAQQHEYTRYLACGIAVYEYQCHFNHFKMAVFDERWSIHGSTNGNFRSLERDKDFELVVLVDDEGLARDVLTRVRDVDVRHAKRFTHDDVEGSFAAFRVRTRDPRTMLLYSRKVP
ncbi:MAG TPA: phosphatidylserine/phosphatidylglycerophosphate/cardiolipin synthase family protein [Polyangiaceae bacterium]|jgi:cardiolipin synthase|nr:phosphatidylserine/phosphatidylglycerophosphate/cardiolipin synthase family protein [Polyangiaceae bacterium]